MDTMISLQSLTPERIREAIRGSLALNDEIARRRFVADFLSSIDWSGADRTPPSDEVRVALATLSRLSTELEEGDIDDSEFLSGLESLSRTRWIRLGALRSDLLGQSNARIENVEIDMRTNRTQTVLITGRV